MKTTDKVLIGIVAGILVLVVVAFILAVARPAPAYQSEDTPQGVAYNYLLALQKEEYERAYSYLSQNIKCYPATQEKFIAEVDDTFWGYHKNTTLSIKSAKIDGDKAIVTVNESYLEGGGLFDSYQSFEPFEMNLLLEKGLWKIINSDKYFSYYWRSYCR